MNLPSCCAATFLALATSSVAASPDRAPGDAPAGMVWLPAGEFTMGWDGPEGRYDERPAHRVHVDGFWMDATEVTNAQFRAFVEATGYVTTAERPVDWEQLKAQLPPGTPKPPDENLAPGSLVFTPPDHPVRLDDFSQWWTWTPGADWRHPEGPGSTIEGRDDHPVVHVSWDDAVAYATWAGRRLPTEAEWERAARLGHDGERYAWGDELTPGGTHMANIWQGAFPHTNTAEDGFATTAPVRSFPPDAAGLYDMAGNVWEWTADQFRPDTYRRRVRDVAPGGCCSNPTGPATTADPRNPFAPVSRVQKGGSFLCHASYCSSYRPSAKMASPPDTGMSHLGFRTVVTPAMRQQATDGQADRRSPLPSWNDGPAKRAILAFLRSVTDADGTSYIPPAQRIAVFDNDGTLWAEQPAYFQLLFAIDRVRTLAPKHPEWRTTQPFKAALEGDLHALAASGKKGLLQLVMATHAGMTADAFEEVVREWITTARHPITGRRYTEMVYQPMLELLHYLRASGFSTWIVSGGGVEFMRVFAEEVYGVPPEQVIGSSIRTEFEMTHGGPVIRRLAEIDFIDDEAGKPVGIHKYIGRRPLMAFGNSDGDLQMLQYTTAGDGPRFGLIVHHTDGKREWAYDRESHVGRLDEALGEAAAQGWTVVDMKRDWRTVFPAVNSSSPAASGSR